MEKNTTGAVTTKMTKTTGTIVLPIVYIPDMGSAVNQHAPEEQKIITGATRKMVDGITALHMHNDVRCQK